MEENKNSEEILNEENQADKGLNEEIISDDNDAADSSSSIENEYSPILDEDADTAYSEESAVANKSNLSIKILIPVIIVLAALIVTAVILAVNKSNKNIIAQIINDTKGETLVYVSTLNSEIKTKKANIEAAKEVGALVAKKALEKNIKTVVFDRGGYIYHGVVKALAEAAREAGLEF